MLHLSKVTRDAVQREDVVVRGLDLVLLALEAILHAQLGKRLTSVHGLRTKGG